uniref:Large ribosomal subunit protein uL23m n=1 Tax=Tabanus bromius TaxID=304241 RepID=A0A0K8TQK2_TABBR
MSTRWYPLYQRGCPQLRIFLPNFWMKLVRPKHELPGNIVQFECSLEMTKHDIRNYLEKIYNVPVVDVRTRIGLGPTRRDPTYGYVVKDDDPKIAYVTLGGNETFKFPDLFPEKDKDKKIDEEKAMDESKRGFKKYLEKHKEKPGVPSWLSI